MVQIVPLGVEDGSPSAPRLVLYGELVVRSSLDCELLGGRDYRFLRFVFPLFGT